VGPIRWSGENIFFFFYLIKAVYLSNFVSRARNI
jgi:hypothetical protein